MTKRLRPPEGVRLATLLAGGGEFAFVVLAAAEKLGALPADLGGLLTAIVLVTMALTPLLSIADGPTCVSILEAVGELKGSLEVAPSCDDFDDTLEGLASRATKGAASKAAKKSAAPSRRRQRERTPPT